MPTVFISYRRADTQHVTDRITDRLKTAEISIFKDVISLRPAQEWPRKIQAALQKCDVLIAVIGKSWLGDADEAGKHRIQRDDDYVRYEVRAAIKRGIPLIPVLTDNASLPSSDVLPKDVQDLVYRQAAHMRADPDFDRDIGDLIRNIRLLAPSQGKSTAIKLGYLIGKLEVFLRSVNRVEHSFAAESVIQKICWLTDRLGLTFDVERDQDGLPFNMRLSTAELLGDVRASFEVGYHVGRFYGLALTFIATGLVQDEAVTDVLQNAVRILPRGGLPGDLLAPVSRHWASISAHIAQSGPLEPKAIRNAEGEADRIIDQLGLRIIED